MPRTGGPRPGALAVPATRTALADAVDSFFGGQARDHRITGQPLTRNQIPRWLAGETRHALVVAGTGEKRLIAYRSQGQYCFLFGAGVGICASGRDWAQQLARNPVVLFGPTGGPGHPRGTLYGFTRGDVATVRLTLSTRPPITASATNGGFAINANAHWKPKRLDVLDANGRTITSVSVVARFNTELNAPMRNPSTGN